MHRLVLVEGKPSHPSGIHEFGAGVRLLARCLEHVPGMAVDVHESEVIPDLTRADVDAVVVFSDGGPSHPLLEGDRLEALGALADTGVGLGFMHYAVEIPVGPGAFELTKWIGGFYEDGVSCNPIWEAEIAPTSDHPISRGVAPFTMTDEWYIGITFGADTHLNPILTATPSDAVRAGPYVWPAGPYPHIVAASGRRETLMWAVQRPDGGRGFGLTGGHFHANWANDAFRQVVLNALVWVTGADVPPSGVGSVVIDADLERDLDEPT
jgi:Trehalose utilisation